MTVTETRRSGLPVIPERVREQVLAHAASSPDAAVAGVLLSESPDGGPLNVSGVIAATSPAHLFSDDQWTAILDRQNRDYPSSRIVGFYQSRPSAQSSFGASDVVLADAPQADPQFFSFVVDLRESREELYAWRNGRIEAVAYRLRGPFGWRQIGWRPLSGPTATPTASLSQPSGLRAADLVAREERPSLPEALPPTFAAKPAPPLADTAAAGATPAGPRRRTRFALAVGLAMLAGILLVVAVTQGVASRDTPAPAPALPAAAQVVSGPPSSPSAETEARRVASIEAERAAAKAQADARDARRAAAERKAERAAAARKRSAARRKAERAAAARRAAARSAAATNRAPVRVAPVRPAVAPARPAPVAPAPKAESKPSSGGSSSGPGAASDVTVAPPSE